MKNKTQYRRVGPHRLPVPSPSPERARAGVLLAMACYGVVACALIGLMSVLPVLPGVGALFNVIVVGAMLWANLVIALITGPRVVKHARRWHQEPSYRQLWERRAAESDDTDRKVPS